MTASQTRGHRIRCFRRSVNLRAQAFIKKATRGGFEEVDLAIDDKDHPHLA
jgi:hypothetical protein